MSNEFEENCNLAKGLIVTAACLALAGSAAVAVVSAVQQHAAFTEEQMVFASGMARDELQFKLRLSGGTPVDVRELSPRSLKSALSDMAHKGNHTATVDVYRNGEKQCPIVVPADYLNDLLTGTQPDPDRAKASKVDVDALARLCNLTPAETKNLKSKLYLQTIAPGSMGQAGPFHVVAPEGRVAMEPLVATPKIVHG